MDPMVGSSVVSDAAISDSSDNAALLDFCFLCSRQFFHNNLDNYGTERLKDEDILETFFEELGPVDRALLQCCPSCQTLCQTLTRTKEALSCLIDEITNLLLRSKKVSYLLSKSRVVSRLFQSSNLSLPPCEVSSSYLQQPLSQINFSKEISNNNSNNCFPTQFSLGLESSNMMSDEDQLDLALSHSNTSSIAKKPPSLKSHISNKSYACGQEILGNCGSAFTSIYNDMINSVSDNACDISEEANLSQSTYKIIDTDLRRNSSYGNSLKESSKLRPSLLALPSSSIDKMNEKILIRSDPKSENKLGINETGHDNEANKLKTDQENFIVPGTNKSSDSYINLANKKNPQVDTKIQNKSVKFKCVLCTKAFQNARNLHSHLTAHKKERKFICELCGASYRQKIGLDSHAAIHKGEPKFQCNLCSKVFSQKIGLQRHLRIHTKRYQYVCDLCGKQFLHHTSFKSHKLVHIGTKNFGCPNCELTFVHKSNLQRHLKVHTGEKPHSCSLCNRSFSQRYNLLEHIKSHDKDPAIAHKCSICSKTYTRKFKLKQHMKHIHNIVT